MTIENDELKYLDTSQAKTVVDKLGGVRVVAERLGIHRTAVYRWFWPRNAKGHGCDGIIPTKRLGALLKMAREEGVLLTGMDLDPRATAMKKPRNIAVGGIDDD